MNKFNRQRRRVYITLLLMFTIILHWASFSSALVSNVAWLYLNEANASQAMRETLAKKALRLFYTAVEVNGTNRRAFLGQGMAYLALNDEVGAFSSWQKAEVDPGDLIGLANGSKLSEVWNEAMFYYKSASRLDSERPEKALYLAINVCQRNFVQLVILSESNRTYCLDYFSRNSNNLIVNGQFVASTFGWSDRYFSGPAVAVYKIDRMTGKRPPAASITGLTEDYHGGLFQSVTLPVGATIHYSAWVKVRGEGAVDVRVLYYGGRQDNKPFGNAAYSITEDVEWTYFERTFRVPEADGSLFTFFPVLLTGKGTVWVDNVWLKIQTGN